MNFCLLYTDSTFERGNKAHPLYREKEGVESFGSTSKSKILTTTLCKIPLVLSVHLLESPTRVKKQRKQLKGGVEVAWKSARTVSINSDMDLVEVEESTSLKSGLRKSEEDELRSPSMKPSLLYTINVDTFDVNNVVLVSQFIEVSICNVTHDNINASV